MEKIKKVPICRTPRNELNQSFDLYWGIYKEEHKHNHSVIIESKYEEPSDTFADIEKEMTRECSVCTLHITKDENLMCLRCQNVFHEKCLKEVKEREMSWPLWKNELTDQTMAKSKEYSRILETLDILKKKLEKEKAQESFCEVHNKQSDAFWKGCNEIVWDRWLVTNKHKKCSFNSFSVEFTSEKDKFEAMSNEIG